MSILVQKYGGSSVADVEKIGLVADKVVAARRRGHDVVVVVSAMGKATDQLLALARQLSSDPPRRELDMLLTTGERVTMALVSIAIAARGCEAISFTGSQSGILTNDRHFDARIIEVRPHRIEDELSRGKVVIVAGYQGMSYRREITTLGRGGSDTTAVALAAALGAERCEIYSDVDGVYSADPKSVDDPVHLPVLDLAVLQEMAEAGAKVLNAQAVEWARRSKITIHARRTSDPEDAAGRVPRETVARESANAVAARAVVGLDKVVFARFSGEAERFIRASSEAELPLLDLSIGTDGASAAIPLLNVPDFDARRRRLSVALGESLSLVDAKALVSVVGDGLTTSAHAVPAFLRALASVGALHSAITAGPLRIGAVIDAGKLSLAERALHAAFVR